jgi:NAD(P)-dependent dehydrogenase (short-subunit alcohol dehydrogenase family)
MKAALLVLGATGIVGRGVVRAAIEAKRPVIAVARDRVGLEQLRSAHPDTDITVVVGSVAIDTDGAALATALREIARPIVGVVAAVAGPSGRGRLLDQPTDALRCKLDADLLPHLAAARALLPLLADAGRGGSYVLIGGPGSELPWAGYGHRSVAAAALRMLTCVLHDEARAMGIRVQLLSVDAPVRIEAQRANACPQWPTAIAIGRRALALVERAEMDEPAHAVVHYAARRRPDSDRLTLTQPQASTSRLATPSETHPATPQVPDSDASLQTARCQQVVRTLLDSLILPNPNQETSPR